MKYRRDIDGLRALAIVPVVIFHAFPSRLPGGFVGVDIFFVISGFLITGILLNEIEEGEFSIARFYERRVRRIFPTAIVVLASAIVFGWFALLPNEYALLGKHVAAAAAFLSNIIYIFESGYFDSASDVKPLLHFWSLAVEEQFYIVWPLVLWAVFRFRLSFPLVASIAIIISLYVNLMLSRNDPAMAFYFPVGRFWELICGGVLAWLMHRQPTMADGGREHKLVSAAKTVVGDAKWLPEVLSALGFSLLLIPFFTLDEVDGLPAWFAVGPVLGALILILTGSGSWLNRSVLMNPISVWIGLISYALYLWHWPVLSFARVINGETPSAVTRILLLFLSLGLAATTYYIVERPIRQARKIKVIVAVCIASMCFLGASGWSIHNFDGFKNRSSISDFEDQVREIVFTGSECPTGFEIVQSCEVIPSTAAQAGSIIVLGDSHARQGFELLKRAGYFQNKDIIGISFGGCPTLLNINTANVSNCIDVNRETLRYLKSSATQPLEIYIAGQWSTYIEPGWLRYGDGNTASLGVVLSDTLAELGKLGSVHVLEQVPMVPFNPQRCFSRPFHQVSDEICEFSLEDSLKLMRASRETVRGAVASVPNVELINFDEVICPGERCNLLSGGALTYFDQTHINPNALR